MIIPLVLLTLIWMANHKKFQRHKKCSDVTIVTLPDDEGIEFQQKIVGVVICL